MIKLFMLIGFVLGISQLSQAQEEKAWEAEIKQWETDVVNMSNTKLTIQWTKSVAAAVATCGASQVVIMSALAADTFPVTNIISEVLANATDEDYQSLDADRSKVGQTAEGLFGGAGAIVRDTVQYVLLLLTGETENAWQNVKDSYESTRVVAEKMTQDEALCTRTSRIEFIIRGELFSRIWGEESLETQTPIEEAVKQTLP
jgi:hypothetical protein